MGGSIGGSSQERCNGQEGKNTFHVRVWREGVLRGPCEQKTRDRHRQVLGDAKPRLLCYGYKTLLLEGPRRVIPGAYRGAWHNHTQTWGFRAPEVWSLSSIGTLLSSPQKPGWPAFPREWWPWMLLVQAHSRVCLSPKGGYRLTVSWDTCLSLVLSHFHSALGDIKWGSILGNKSHFCSSTHMLQITTLFIAFKM